MKYNNNIMLFSIRNSFYLSKRISSIYKKKLNNIYYNNFNDGEYKPFFSQSIINKNIFVIGSLFQPSDNLMELLLVCDAAKRSFVKNITAVIPYLGWSRQDKNDTLRSSISIKLIANLLTVSGIDKIITLDLHNNQIQGFFDIPIHNIYSIDVFIEYIKNLNLNDLVIVSPDIGGIKRANLYAKYLKTNTVICYKERTNEINTKIRDIKIMGDVKNKNVIIIDDLIDTGNTIIKISNIIYKLGAISIRCIITHPVLSKLSYNKIDKSFIKELVVSDSIPIKKKISKIKVISCSNILVKYMKNIY